MNNKKHIHLKVLSPLCIGNDQAETLSPYTDFVVSEEEDQIHYIDKREFEFALVSQNRVDEFAQQISGNIDNNRSLFRLREFITHTLAYELEEISRQTLPNFGVRNGERQQIKATLKSGSQPYISGSTLKGAIRTALLHHWLETTDEGNKLMDQGQEFLIQAYNTINSSKLEYQYNELRDLQSRRKRGQRLERFELYRMWDLDKEIKEVIKKLLDESKLFGLINDRDNQRPPISQFLQVSDTVPFGADRLAIFQAHRVRLAPLNRRGRKGSNIPEPREAIIRGSETSFSIGLRPEIQASKLGHLFAQHPDSLLDIIRKWSKACIGLELYHLDEAYEMPSKGARATLREFYGKLYEGAEKGKTYLRLGRGKTYYENSLGVALMNYAEDHLSDEDDEQFPPEDFRTFRKYALGVSMRSDLFPITRSITTIGHQPMGWVELSV
ncbi:MAG: type III-A CRISPR-associated RAMP protein Csm5 [Bacteroidota bacterium]